MGLAADTTTLPEVIVVVYKPKKEDPIFIASTITLPNLAAIQPSQKIDDPEKAELIGKQNLSDGVIAHEARLLGKIMERI